MNQAPVPAVKPFYPIFKGTLLGKKITQLSLLFFSRTSSDDWAKIIAFTAVQCIVYTLLIRRRYKPADLTLSEKKDFPVFNFALIIGSALTVVSSFSATQLESKKVDILLFAVLLAASALGDFMLRLVNEPTPPNARPGAIPI